MEDQNQDPSSPNHGSERSEPVRSRWSPKPEQILILESIFNSGMVNPPKDETVRIRKLLEKFGTVGDANVFYWFQNRRSRSRRRQRQMQASLGGEQSAQPQSCGAIQSENTSSGSLAGGEGFVPSASFFTSQSSCLLGSSSGGGVGNEAAASDFFSYSGQIGVTEIEQNSPMTSSLGTSDITNLHYQPGFITVFINGVATDVPRAPLDMKAMFGQDFVLVHSSGIPVPFNEYGFSLQSLQHGESYFLVPRPT